MNLFRQRFNTWGKKIDFSDLVKKICSSIPVDPNLEKRNAGYSRLCLLNLWTGHKTTMAQQQLDYLLQVKLRNHPEKGQLKSKSDGWFPVSSAILKERFGSNYMSGIQELYEAGLILRNDGKHGGPRRYSNSATSEDSTGFCIAIKITEEAMRSGTRMEWVKIPQKDHDRIEKHKRNRFLLECFEDVQLLREPDYREIEYCEHLKYSVSLDPAYEKRISKESKRRRAAANRIKNKGERLKALEEATLWEMSAMVTAEAVDTKNWWVVQCVGKRVHTPITSMPKIIRGYLRLNGSPLVELDISNSQPAFFGALLTWLSQSIAPQIKEMLRESDARPRKKGKKRRRIVSDKEYRETYGRHMTYLADPEEPDSREVRPTKTPEWVKYQSQNVSESAYERSLDRRVAKIQEALQDTKGVQQYIEDVASGQFYEVIMEALGIDHERRPEVKEEVLKAFYQRLPEQRGQKPSEIGIEIKQRYAAAYAVMDAFKKEAHAAFAITMQGQESQAMQSEEFKAMQAIMIHDAVLVTEDKAETALKQLGKQLQETGVKAQIQIERKTEKEQTATEPKDSKCHRVHSRSNNRKHSESHIQNGTLKPDNRKNQLSQTGWSPTPLYVAKAKRTASRTSMQLRTITPSLSWERGIYLSFSSRNELVAPKTRPPP